MCNRCHTSADKLFSVQLVGFCDWFISVLAHVQRLLRARKLAVDKPLVACVGYVRYVASNEVCGF